VIAFLRAVGRIDFFRAFFGKMRLLWRKQDVQGQETRLKHSKYGGDLCRLFSKSDGQCHALRCTNRPFTNNTHIRHALSTM